jgi:DNA invertase Pin-like site-specific DNA recombinase
MYYGLKLWFYINNQRVTMKHQIVGYTRVSTADQNTERQLDGMELDKVFTDKASGKDTNRPALQSALTYLREGDTLVVHSLDRLARNLEDMFRIVRELNTKGVSVRFVKENLAFDAVSNDPRATLLFSILSSFAQFERSIARERQREGIAIAKAKGVYKGGAKKLTAQQVADIKQRVAAGIPRARIAKDLGITRQTLYNYVPSSKGSTVEERGA